MRKFDCDPKQLMHVELHWLDVPEQVKFKLVLMVLNCLHHKASRYLMDYCIPISDVANQWHLHSASRHYLVVPRYSLSSYGCRTFAVAGPTAWNSVSDDLRDLTLSTDSFRRLLKLGCFQSTSTYSAVKVSHFMHWINAQLTFLLAYILRAPASTAMRVKRNLDDLGKPPKSHSAQMYGPGRSSTYRPSLCAVSMYRLYNITTIIRITDELRWVE